MKLFQDYKRQSSRIFLLLLFLGLVPFFVSFAQTADELQSKINQKNTDIEKIEKEISRYQSELNTLSKQKNTLSGLIKQLDLTRKKLVADINLTQSKIDKTNLKIQSLNTDISRKESSITNDSTAIKLGLKRIDEFEQSSLIETILSEEDFTTVWNDVDNMITVRQVIIDKIQKLKILKGELEDTRDVAIDAKNELIALKSELADEKKIVEQNKAEKDKILKQTKNNESNYQKLLKDQVAKKLALESELRDYESKLKFILDPSALPSGGVLSWPLSDVYVTQLFGKTSASKRLYASGSHSGVDFRASVGTPVYAMADGIVLGSGDTDLTCPNASFGKWMLIEYNNGLSSAYGHLSLSKAYEGQKVKRGDLVAYTGNTGHTTGPHLHVTVYASRAVSIQTIPSKSCSGRTLTQPIAATNAYLDPMYYLPSL